MHGVHGSSLCIHIYHALKTEFYEYVWLYFIYGSH